MTCRGMVKGNVVVPEEGISLPDGAAVEIRLIGRSPMKEARTKDAHRDMEIAKAQSRAIFDMETVCFGPGPTGQDHDEVLYGGQRWSL